MSRVFISYRHVEPDITVARAMAASLSESGHDVFIDTKIPLGQEWGAFIEEHLGDADWLVAFVSAAAADSPMVVTEIAEAHRLNGEGGRPGIIPVRLGDGFRLRYPLSAYLSRFQQGEWRGPADTAGLIARVTEALTSPSPPRRVASQRQAMIERVRGDWIKGVLEKSLHQVARLELGLTVDQTAVARGLDVVVHSAAIILCVGAVISTPFVWYSRTLEDSGVFGAGLMGLSFLSWGGLFIALERGGYFIIRHYIARVLLWHRKWGPWHYVRFLDAAAERIFLRKVGGGYIFVHRLLMEFLAGSSRGAWGAASPG